MSEVEQRGGGLKQGTVWEAGEEEGGETLLVKNKLLKDAVSRQLGALCLSQTISF